MLRLLPILAMHCPGTPAKSEATASVRGTIFSRVKEEDWPFGTVAVVVVMENECGGGFVVVVVADATDVCVVGEEDIHGADDCRSDDKGLRPPLW